MYGGSLEYEDLENKDQILTKSWPWKWSPP